MPAAASCPELRLLLAGLMAAHVNVLTQVWYNGDSFRAITLGVFTCHRHRLAGVGLLSVCWRETGDPTLGSRTAELLR